jgi:hypothetical protein
MYYYLGAEARPDLPNLTHVMCKCVWESAWRIRKAALPVKKPLGEKAAPTCGKATWRIPVAEAGQRTCIAVFLPPSFSTFLRPPPFLPPLLLKTPQASNRCTDWFLQDLYSSPASTGNGTSAPPRQASDLTPHPRAPRNDLASGFLPPQGGLHTVLSLQRLQNWIAGGFDSHLGVCRRSPPSFGPHLLGT